ncbi:SDR family oxidoreductase [Flagellimonas sp. HMM57]|uniref:SDR family oxidoreductase n=1 Tax=unclassified Flagellimonas TaxID=2644544 RepID=UPI0013D679F1|nr:MULTISPECIES: SDR family oxidoreductase [unclassified Flagellimonas]UII74911.1 SDR family oxidoreductase [Flagellimonas sp. HMM57]
MKISLAGKNALVGGSSKGIGEAIARQLAASGANVTLMARNEAKMKELIAEFDVDQGQEHNYVVVDFSSFETFKPTISKFFQENTIDILVNNTQGPEAGGALEKNVEDYQQAFDLLFKSVVFTTELALKHMQKKQWGRIINVASISVREPLNYLALSNSIRAAVVTWAKSLSIDVAKDGITVNNVLTGYFDTDRITQLNAKKAEKLGITALEVRSNMENQVPSKRIGDPEEYGFLVTFLASEKSAYITGTNIPIDGGLLKSL